MRLHLHCCTLALHAHVDVRSTHIRSVCMPTIAETSSVKDDDDEYDDSQQDANERVWNSITKYIDITKLK